MDKFCRNCGAKRREGAKFCVECGNKFDSVKEEPAKAESLKEEPIKESPAMEESAIEKPVMAEPAMEVHEKIIALKNDDEITLNMFGKPKKLRVFSTGDNQFDEDGDYKEGAFDLSQEELDVLNWFVENVKIEDYAEEIIDYCEDEYSACADEDVKVEDLEEELDIYAIAINVTKIWQSKDGYVYPEISFYGDCKCDPEHGICIGFRDKKFLGVEAQDWTL